MRPVAFSIAIMLFIGCSSAKNAKMDHQEINGTWVPIRQELSGKELPTAALINQKLIINNNMYTVITESVDKGEVKYSSNKIDIYGKEGVNAGKHFTAIYKYSNQQLAICYNLSGSGYPETFDTKGKPMYFLSVFKKSK